MLSKTLPDSTEGDAPKRPAAQPAVNTTAISVEGVSKHFRIYKNQATPVWDILIGAAKDAAANFWNSFGLGRQRADSSASVLFHDASDFTALDNVTFDVAKGEAFAILGRNGAGKSTLLQIIAGTLPPSSGRVEIGGRIGALLELGSGLNPEYSGVENIFLGASLLGLSREETQEKLQLIIDFADIGSFIDQPIHTYSSGMQVRLAFAINSCLKPDILIIDEALAVGDAPFQAKCYRHLRNLMDTGTTVLFTSHSIDTVRSLCSRALWIDRGKVRMLGAAREVANGYERFCWSAQGTVLENETDSDPGAKALAQDAAATLSPSQTTGPIATRDGVPLPLLEANPELNSLPSDVRFGTMRARVRNVLCTDLQGNVSRSFSYNDTLYLHVLVESRCELLGGFEIGVTLKDIRGVMVCSCNHFHQKPEISWQAGTLAHAVMKVPVMIPHGTHILKIAILGVTRDLPNNSHDFTKAEVFDCIEQAAIIDVSPDETGVHAGPVTLEAPISLETITS